MKVSEYEKIPVCIIEDAKGDYYRMCEIFETPPFDNDFKVVGKFFGEQPYDEALHFIKEEKPHLLIIDFDLGEGSQKTGLNLYHEISDYQFFAIYYSRDSDHASAALGGFGNVQFIKKKIDPIVPLDQLQEKLELAKRNLTGYKTIKLKYYPDNKLMDEPFDEIQCMDLALVKGKEKQYYYYFYDNKRFIERCGPASYGTGTIVEEIMSKRHPDFVWLSKNPNILVNKRFFTVNRTRYTIKDHFRGIYEPKMG